MLLLGVSQYWFIVVRSKQGTTYLESRATSISELVSVVTAQRFANERFAFGPKALIVTQLPAVTSAIRREMGAIGVLLLITGSTVALWQGNAAAMLVLASTGGLLGMVMNLAGDLRGFITPVVVLLWPLAALAIQMLVDALSRQVIARYAVLAAAATLSLAGVLSNYDASNHSRNTEDAQFFRAIFTQLPDTAEIVMENYWNAMMINYLSFTEETGRRGGLWQVDSRGPTIRKLKRDGRRVFAFAGAATFLTAEGLQFQRVALEGPSLNAWLRKLPRSSLVVGATANTPVPMESIPIDRSRAPAIGAFHPFGAFTWVAGEPTALVEMHDVKASLTHGNIVATADRSRARIQLDGHTIVEIGDGIVLAVLAPDGRLLRTFEFHSGEPLRVGFQGALYEFKGDSPCVDVMPDDWSDITAIANAGSWVAALDVYGSVTIETEFSSAPDRLKPGGAAASVKLCAEGRAPLFSDEKVEAVLRPDFESEPYFGPGWNGPQRTDGGAVRQFTDEASTLLLPLNANEDYRLTLIIEGDRDTRLQLEANGTTIGACQVADADSCEITIPRDLVRDGVNRISLAATIANPQEPTPKTLTFRGARLHRFGAFNASPER